MKSDILCNDVLIPFILIKTKRKRVFIEELIDMTLIPPVHDPVRYMTLSPPVRGTLHTSTLYLIKHPLKYPHEIKRTFL